MTDTCPMPSALKVFFADTRRHLSEVDVYLSKKDGIAKQAILQAVLRRFEAVYLGAKKHNLAAITEFCEALVQSLQGCPDSAAVRTRASVLLLQITSFLNRYLRCEELRLSDHLYPEGWESFFEECRTELLADLQQSIDAPLDISRRDTDPYMQMGMGGKMNILIADDEDMVRFLIVDILASSGQRVFSVKNGREALAAVKPGFFDIIFTDIKMPGATGIDVLKEARACTEDLEVVIITGYATVENAAEAVRFGAYDYLTKPFKDTNELRAVAKRAQEHLRLRRRNQYLLQTLQRTNKGLQRHADSLEDALQSLEENRRALLHADRLKSVGELAAGVAHEINNPTTFIRGNLQTLERFWRRISPALEKMEGDQGTPPLSFIIEEMPKMMDDMVTGTDRISRIVSGLQSFAHQPTTEQRHPVNLLDCIQGALDLVGNRIKGVVTLEIKVPENLPIVMADAQQLTQVFLNLFVNAADAMGNRDRARLTVIAHADANHLSVRVSDNGTGIPTVICDRIFNPFFTTKEVGKGTGLGLAISHGIIQKHGGVLKMESSVEGVGTTFVVRLPRQGKTLAEEILPHILIVDDDPYISTFLESALQSTGLYEVDCVFSGEAALASIHNDRPDLLLLDVVMPEMDGFEVIAKLREDESTKNIKIISITGLSEVNVKSQLMALGVQKVLFKPFKPRILLDNVSQVLSELKPKQRKEISVK